MAWFGNVFLAFVLFLLPASSAATPGQPTSWRQPPVSAQVEMDTPSKLPAPTFARFPTVDMVVLAGDYYRNTKSGNAVILLHMIPPAYDRRSWPKAFIEALHAKGWSVFAIDRRGAGDSRGYPIDAYVGPAGRHDVAAAVEYLRAQGDARRFAVVAASNGTTTALDYAEYAPRKGLPKPSAMVFMSGGPYTEYQRVMSLIRGTNIQLLYSASESAWANKHKGKSDRWVFKEYPQDGHGTDMFQTIPQVTADIVTYLDTHL